ncbi:MAG: FCD domain-containing protein [Streptosporangiales bacterium]|nr:FCD domain-containing protein [Streptosporangiales bacterium]
MAKLDAADVTVKRPNLKQEVAKYVRDLILSGGARPGQRLDQDRIAEELGVSRLPVREALITLEGEGLVENVARHGSYVASLEPADISDQFEMYGLLSGLAAARAAIARPDGMVEQLEQIVAQMRVNTDPREHDRLNFMFHQVINKAGASRRLVAVLRTLSGSMPTHFFEHHTGRGFREQALDEHDTILEALRNGDGQAASTALIEHFTHTGKEAVQMLRENGFWDHEES